MSAGELQVLLATMHRSLQVSIHTLERRTMTQLDDLNTKISALEASTAAANSKSDTLISLVGDLRTELAAAQAGGTAIDLTSALARIDAVTSSLNSEASKEDAAISSTTTTGTATTTSGS